MAKTHRRHKGRKFQQTVMASVAAVNGNPVPLLRLIGPMMVGGLLLALATVLVSSLAFLMGGMVVAAGAEEPGTVSGEVCTVEAKTTGALPVTVPEPYKSIFLQAAAPANTDVNLLATIFWKENGKRYPVPPPPYGDGPAWPVSYQGAVGPMQFLPSTWSTYATDGNGDGRADPNDLTDAIYGAARMLAVDGGVVGTPLGSIDDIFAENTLVNVMGRYHAGYDKSGWGPKTRNYITDGADFYTQLVNDPLANPQATTETTVCVPAPVAAVPVGAPTDTNFSTNTSACPSFSEDLGITATFSGAEIRLCDVQGAIINASLADALGRPDPENPGLFLAAKQAGIELSAGSTFRSYQEQVKLRLQNGCGTSLTTPSSACRVPTAPPGKSMHEQGLAIDIKYNGRTICYPLPSSSCRNNPGFDWLKANAHRFGLINYPDEAWHWSTNGK